MRRVLLLLLALELILPPGFCICRLERFALRAVEPPAPSRCPCCRKPAPATPQLALPTPVTPDGPHVPACPAHPSWEVSHAVRLGPSSFDPIDVLPAVAQTGDLSGTSFLVHFLPLPDPHTPPLPHRVLRC